MFATVATARPFFPQGRLRPLGVTTPKRTVVLPDVPAIAEVLPGYEMSGWIGLLAPAQTPREIVSKVNGELASFVHSPAVKQRILKEGWEPVGSPPQLLADVIVRELPNRSNSCS